jgi:hypothetical protein
VNTLSNKAMIHQRFSCSCCNTYGISIIFKERRKLRPLICVESGMFREHSRNNCMNKKRQRWKLKNSRLAAMLPCAHVDGYKFKRIVGVLDYIDVAE